MDWFVSLQLPPSTGKHDQLNQAQINLVLDRLETIPSVVGEVQVFKEGTTGHWCDFAMMETLWDFSSCPGKTESWWPSTAQIGTKMLYLPKPRPRVWIVPVSSLLGRLPLIAAGDTGTVPHSMHGVMPASDPGGVCDTVDQHGAGSVLFYINSWAIFFPSDHPAD